MRVLITRPEPDAQDLAEELRRRGHEPCLAPLLETRPSDHPPPEDYANRVLVFTSVNGVRMAEARGLANRHPVYVVGEATARAARSAGHVVAAIGEGDGAALVQLLAAALPRTTRLLHVSGADTAGNLAEALTRLGFEAERFIVYAAAAVPRLPDAAGAFLKGPSGAALLFSPRTATLLAELVVAARLEAQAAKHCALALSAAVAGAAASLPWHRIEAAPRPTMQALLALLEGLVRSWPPP